MEEGKILLAFIENQRKSKKLIAEEIGMSRRNLYQLFESQTLNPETKQKFESYFSTKIFEQGSLKKATSISNDIDKEMKSNKNTDEVIESLRAQIKILENHCGFLQKTYEERLSTLEANLKTNQDFLKAVMAQIRAATLRASERFAGADKKKLAEERHILDKYASEFLTER